MKDRTIPLLLVCILVVGAVITVQEYWRAQNPRREYLRRAVFDLIPDTLTDLQFKGTNSVIDCLLQNGRWMVGNREQSMGRADPGLVYKLVAQLNSMGKGTTITAKQLNLRGLDASDYGLESPELEITAVDNRGRHVWQIGHTTPTELEVYVREADSDEIYTIPSKIWEIIPKDPDDLRNRIVFPGDLAGIRRLEVRGDTGFLSMTKDAANLWQIQQPIIAQADPFEVAAYIERLQEIRIVDFFDENVADLSAYGLQGESRQIALGLPNGSSSTLVLGDPVPGRPGLIYARRADDTSVFGLKDEVLELLNIKENDLRDARILTLPMDQISSVVVRHGDEQLAMSATESGWQITRPAAWAAETESVYNLIDFWSHAVITEFNVNTNAAASEWVIEFGAASSGITNRIEIMPAGDRKDGLFVRLNNDPSIFQINLPTVPASIIDPLAYKSHRIWDLQYRDINKLVLQRRGTSPQAVERSHDGAFVAADANGNAQVDTRHVEQAVNRLCTIKTTGYIAYNPRNLEIYGLAEPSLELYVGLVNSNELGRVLLVGRESTDGFYSMVKGRDVVFYLDGETVDILSADLFVMPKSSMRIDE